MVYRTLNEDQVQLCRECGMDPEGYGLDRESEECLRLYHLTSGNTVVIWKGIARKRAEQEAAAGKKEAVPQPVKARHRIL